MEKKKFNFKKLGIVLCVCFITLFAFVPFINSKKINSVYASETVSAYYDYTGASTISLTSILSLNSDWRETLPIDVRFDLYTSSLGTRISGDFCYYSTIYSAPYLTKHDLKLFTTSKVEVTLNNLFAFNSSQQLFLAKSSSDLSSYGGFAMGVVNHGNFTGNIKYIELGSVVGYKVLNYGSNQLKAFYIKYIETEADYFYIEFAMPRLIEYEPRVYWISDPSNFTSNEFYQQGYGDGYNDGVIDGDGLGFDKGYDTGLIEGYDNGYNAGINDSNQYSFYNLFGAVIDAPVKVFSSLFNFNLLGINIFGLITGLLTLAMVILVLKLIFGGG